MKASCAGSDLALAECTVASSLHGLSMASGLGCCPGSTDTLLQYVILLQQCNFLFCLESVLSVNGSACSQSLSAYRFVVVGMRICYASEVVQEVEFEVLSLCSPKEGAQMAGGAENVAGLKPVARSRRPSRCRRMADCTQGGSGLARVVSLPYPIELVLVHCELSCILPFHFVHRLSAQHQTVKRFP